MNVMEIQLKLPNGYLEPEFREGFFVDAKRKKIWAVELDLLSQFTRVCEKYNLSYYLDGGTLLGAVRHKGFIPWDDDVDVIMPREDYDKLFEVAEIEFKEPYFFQTPLTETNFFRGHAKLRNSSTTGYILDDRKKKINNGIWLDIFPLDGVADLALQRIIQKYHIWLLRGILR